METSQKVDVLLASLNERYESLRAIRERVQNVGLTAIGLLLAAGGWIIQDQAEFECISKIVALLGLVATIAFLRLRYLSDLERGFKAQQRIAAKLEKALGLYTEGWIAGCDALLPESWSHAGTERGSGGFFRNVYLMLYLGSAFLASTLIFVA